MRAFWIVAGVLLGWNLIGDAAYLVQVSADLDKLALSDPITADAFRSMPWWAWSAYAVAVWFGTAGAIALLLRRRIAVPLFACALIGIVVQFGWSFLGYGLIARKGVWTVAFPILLVLIAAAALLYARAKVSDRTLR